MLIITVVCREISVMAFQSTGNVTVYSTAQISKHILVLCVDSPHNAPVLQKAFSSLSSLKGGLNVLYAFHVMFGQYFGDRMTNICQGNWLWYPNIKQAVSPIATGKIIYRELYYRYAKQKYNRVQYITVSCKLHHIRTITLELVYQYLCSKIH